MLIEDQDLNIDLQVSIGIEKIMIKDLLIDLNYV